MTRKTKCVLGANAVTAAAGIHGIVSPNGLTATGIGLFNIAASGTVNALGTEGVISARARKIFATLLLIANLMPAALGIATVLDCESSTSAGLGQIALGVASSVQCLDGIGLLKGKTKDKE